MRTTLFILILIIIGCASNKELIQKESGVYKVKLSTNCYLQNDKNKVIEYISTGSIILLEVDENKPRRCYLGKIKNKQNNVLIENSNLFLVNPNFNIVNDSLEINISFVDKELYNSFSDNNGCYVNTDQNEKLEAELFFCGKRGNRFVSKGQSEILKSVDRLPISREQKDAMEKIYKLYTWDRINFGELDKPVIALYHEEIKYILGPELYKGYLKCSDKMLNDFYW